MAKMKYKMSSRATILLGRESVSRVDGAIIELVKNTYDADAGFCCLCFDVEHDQIYILDNGVGMTKETIETCWMLIGTDNKRVEYLSTKKRIKSGEKGIGRFALDRLGSKCRMYTKHDSEDLIKPADMLQTCIFGSRVKHEMALEAAVVYDLCHNRVHALGAWDYVSHQVIASPFKPIDYMDKIDVLAMRYLPNTKIPCKYLVAELKKDAADNATIDQVLKYVDWVCSEYAYGDYEAVEACIIAAEYPENIAAYYSEVVQRYYTLGSHPVRNKQWNSLKLLRYSYAAGELSYVDVTPQNEMPD